MRPVSAAFLDAVAQSHRAVTVIEVLGTGLVTAVITSATQGTVTLDAKAQVRGRLDLTVVDDGTLGLVPTSAASLLAPYGNELHVSRGVRHPDGTAELVGLGVFRIDEATLSDGPTGLTVHIAGQDRAARIIDARFEEPYEVAQGTNVADAILATIQIAYPDVAYSFAVTDQTTPKLIAEEGSDRWKFCTDMATAAGLTLYFDGDGNAVLHAGVALGGDPVATIAEGESGVLLTAARRWSREGAFNRVIATGENTGETAPARGVATDDNALSPTYYYGPFGKVPRFYTSPFVKTDAQASDAAASILAKELGTTQRVDFGTVVNPALEPDDIVRITRARAGVDEDHIVDSLTIPLAATDPMTGNTRALQVTS